VPLPFLKLDRRGRSRGCQRDFDADAQSHCALGAEILDLDKVALSLAAARNWIAEQIDLVGARVVSLRR